MLFGNLSCFRFASDMDMDALAAALETRQLRPVGPLELQTTGFVSPLGEGVSSLTYRVGDAMLVTIAAQERLLPSDVLNRELAARVRAITEKEGRRVGAKERKRLKDDVLTAMLPQAFVRERRTNAYFTTDGWLVIDTSSRKVAELVVAMTREALGSFPCTPIVAEESPRVLMTDWVTTGKMPEGLYFGDACELRESCEDGAVVRCSHQDLESDEVREHLRSGKQVFRLDLAFHDRLELVLDETLCVRRLRFTDVVQDQLGETDFESRVSEIDATFALMTGELRALLEWMTGMFGISDAPKLKLDGGDAAPEDKAAAAVAAPHSRGDRGARAGSLESGKAATIGTSLSKRIDQCHLDSTTVGAGLTTSELLWIREGQRCPSSETVFATLVGISTSGCALCHPLDPADLRRCRLLVEQVPEFAPRIGEMTEVSIEWAALVRVWGTLCAEMDTEDPDWRHGAGTCPNTYEFMREVLST